MSDVTSLDDHRPHVVVDATRFGGAVYVAPVAYWTAWLAGEDVEPPSPEVLRALVHDALFGS